MFVGIFVAGFVFSYQVYFVVITELSAEAILVKGNSLHDSMLAQKANLLTAKCGSVREYAHVANACIIASFSLSLSLC